MVRGMAASAASATHGITHEGIVNVVIKQGSINQPMQGAQGIEATVPGGNEGTGIEAIKMVMAMMALVRRVLVRLCVDVRAHIGNFEAVVENRIQLLQRQAKDTFEAAKKGYELNHES